MSAVDSLIAKKREYQIMKEYVEKVLYILSSYDIKDDISTVQTALNSYYLVNDDPVKYDEIGNQKDRISECKASLREIINAINSKIREIEDAISEAMKAEEEAETS